MSGMFGLLAIASRREREDIAEGLVLAVKSYYEDYSDAEAVDPEFYRALEVLAVYADQEADDIITAGEVLVNDENPRRRFRRMRLDDIHIAELGGAQ